MNNSKVWIDPRCLGDTYLVAVKPNVYVDGKRVEEPVGHSYEVVLPAHSFDKLSVKIDGKQLVEAPTEGYVPVVFEQIVVRPYVTREGRLAYTASAQSVRLKK